MELEELGERLIPFSRAMYDDPQAEVEGVHRMPGHAGFSYGFTVRSRGREESWYLRLPPPKVRWKGTADVLRQAAVLRALEGTRVPHCTLKWSGDDLRWFERPYFVVPKLEGEVVGIAGTGFVAELDAAIRQDMARQAMTALAEIHGLDWQAKVPELGPPIPFSEDVTRWDRFTDRVAEPELLARAPELRERLLGALPADAPVGLFHGDFQWSNLFYSREGTLLAVIDWELVGIGAILNDAGWIATFNDPAAWDHPGAVSGLMPGPEELLSIYADAYGAPLPDLGWFRALAAYKFAIITGFNLGLHRRGKRSDPVWEVMAPSMKSLVERALELLG